MELISYNITILVVTDCKIYTLQQSIPTDLTEEGCIPLSAHYPTRTLLYKLLHMHHAFMVAYVLAPGDLGQIHGAMNRQT